MTGGQLLLDCLLAQGVRTVFGQPGNQLAALYRALERQQDRVRHITVRNEQAGAYAADGYARVSGRPGVICTTAGPGATNALSGIAEAYADSVPVLLVTGQVNHDRLHQEHGAYHEIVNLSRLGKPATDLVTVVGPICETGDRLGSDRQLPPTKENDVLLIANAGAYGYAMSSRYNLREPAPEVLI